MRGDAERDAARAFLQRQGWDTPEHRLRAAKRFLLHHDYRHRFTAAALCWETVLSEFVYRKPRWTPLHFAAIFPPDAWPGFLEGYLGEMRRRVQR